MKILMLVNWKIQYCESRPADKQPPDYCAADEPYWFFRYFREQPEVDVVDTSSFPWLENFEKNKLRFYIWQALKVLPKLGKYDLIVSHGMQSGIVISLWRRLFKTKAKHIVIDVGCFNRAKEQGAALKLMQFAGKSIDGLIYHTSSQLGYYEKFHPWLVPRSRFIRFGTDLEFFDPADLKQSEDRGTYMICIGFRERDRETLVAAYQKLHTDMKLRLVGYVDERYQDVPGIEQFPPVPVREMIRQVYNAAFAVLPLKQYNFSYGQMTLMQQMALGKCVIASAVHSLVDYIGDGAAVAYEPSNAEDLAEKMEKVLRDESYRDAVAKKGQAYLREQCNEKIMAAEMETFFRETLR